MCRLPLWYLFFRSVFRFLDSPRYCLAIITHFFPCLTLSDFSSSCDCSFVVWCGSFCVMGFVIAGILCWWVSGGCVYVLFSCVLVCAFFSHSPALFLMLALEMMKADGEAEVRVFWKVVVWGGVLCIVTGSWERGSWNAGVKGKEERRCPWYIIKN